MGEVWRGTDLVLGRPVAVKLLQAGYAEHADTLARFRAEARHAAAVTHPAIAQVYDYSEAGPGHPPFLVMELVDGPPLTELLAAGPLPPMRVLGIMAQTADGLAAAHAAGLVHRDIKPGNLLIGPGDTVKITDFGIAYAAGSAPLTRTGTLIGTPAYLAPERVAGASARPASDLYSLGIVAYECLAGSPPFSGTSVEIALAHRHGALPALPAAVPRPVVALVSALTAKDPAQRPANAQHVAAQARQLRTALAGHRDSRPPIEPRLARAGLPPPTEAEMHTARLTHLGEHEPLPERAGSLRRLAARRPVLLAVATVALVVALGGWLVATGSGTTPPQHTSRPHLTAGTRMVTVSGALIGQPPGAVAQQLRGLGLRVTLQSVPAFGQQPGTVVSIQPSGRVRVGSTVLVVVAGQHRHDHGRGNGGFNGNGGFAGNGGGD
jgi:eukaryotic-like serine/threonine-protein kinase